MIKYVKVDDVNLDFKIQMERKIAALETYQRLHQEVAETATQNVEALRQDLLQQDIHVEHTHNGLSQACSTLRSNPASLLQDDNGLQPTMTIFF